MYRTLVALALVASSAPAAVAAQAIAGTPGPADPAAAVPAVKYESAFDGYRPFREEKAADWRAVNDDVARAGGHVGIMGGASGHGGRGDAKSAPAGDGHKH